MRVTNLFGGRLRIAARRCGLSAVLIWNPAAARRSSFCPTSCCWLAQPTTASKPVKAQKAISFVTAIPPVETLLTLAIEIAPRNRPAVRDRARKLRAAREPRAADDGR